MINPIVQFWFFLGFAFSVVLCNVWSGIAIYCTVCIFLLLLNIQHIKPAISQVKIFVYFFPVMIIIYLVVSFLFTQNTWDNILFEAGFAFSKLILLIMMMALYFEISKNNDLLLAVRSLWSKLNIPWHWVEDLFLFLGLTLRFYPTFQREWDTIRRSKIALGLGGPDGKLQQIKSATQDLPGLILQSYRKAENTASVMIQRGYGNKIPRGVANPILFNNSDLVLLVLITIGYTILSKYVTL